MTGRKSKRNHTNERLTIPEFFEDKSVFITGASGFMGKVLLEKLLRSCPGVKKIYILMRPKKGVAIEARLKAMLSLPMFIRLKRDSPESFAKVIPFEGDVREEGLGLKPDDAQTLKDEVSIVFHAAASVRFDDKLRDAVLLNLRGTLETVKLALEMKKLQTFLHVSTSYCVKYRPRIEEIIYEPPAEWRTILHLVETVDENTMQIMTAKILDEYPNTYTFTKALAEAVVKEYSDRIPTAIYRPSIVIATLHEPLPGWVDNFNGPVGLVVACGKGIVRTVFSDPNLKSDFIPCDIAVKAMIACAWNRATALEPFDELTPVFNAANNDYQLITQQEMVQLGHEAASQVPINNILWLPGGKATSWRLLFYIKAIILHLFPALLVDAILKFYNKPPMLAKIQRRIYVANMALEYFVFREWHFVNEKLKKLNYELLEEDKPAFNYIFEDVDLLEYFKSCIFTSREHLLKEDISELDAAKKHYRRMYWVDKVAKVLLLAFLAYLLVKLEVPQLLRYMVQWIISYFLNIFEL